MRVKTIIDEDFTNYKKASMFIGTISCNGKCCIEANIPLSICQNDGWRCEKAIDIDDKNICERYLNNNLTDAIVIGGLEPFEQFSELCDLIECLRINYHCNDDIVIYTGYNYNEISNNISILKKYSNIIIKYGRFIPNAKSRYDEVLGITLVSDNQYGEKIS